MTSFCLKQPALIKNVCRIKGTSVPKVTFLSSPRVMCHSKRQEASTKDPKDIEHLSKYSKDWWNPESFLKGLHSLNVLRVPFIRDSLVTMNPDTPYSTCLKGKKILDVGCGGGFLTEDLAKLGCEITGIDPCRELINIANDHAILNSKLDNKPKYIHTTIEEHINSHSNYYDAVVASEVIEHIDQTQQELFVESCVKALKPGGKIIFTTPTRTRISQLLGIFLAETLNVVPWGTHHYHKFTTPSELKYCLEMNDCRVELTQGYVYYFWSRTWKWINWQALMFAMRAVKLDNTK